MRNSLPFSKPYRTFYLSAMAISFIGIIWLYIVSNFEGHTFVGCPSKLLLHIPCPGCGMTRATLCLLQGDILLAVWYNPNSVIFIPFVLIEALVGFVDLIMSKLYAYQLFYYMSNYMGKPFIFCVFIIFEMSVLIHNIIVGI